MTNTNETDKTVHDEVSEEERECKPSMVTIGTQTDEVTHVLYESPKTPPKHLWKSIKLNWVFYISLLGCCYIMSKYTKYSFLQAFTSVLFISLLGYFVHMTGHYISFTKIYAANDNYFSRSSILNPLVKGICRFFDFHDVTHHDSSINKQPMNVIYEFINNFVLQGGLVVFLASIAHTFCIPAILLWALMYATVHNINYILMPPKTHQNHHMNKHSSYGLDIWDILFNTKADPDEVEVYNHMSINLILITLGLCYYYNRKS